MIELLGGRRNDARALRARSAQIEAPPAALVEAQSGFVRFGRQEPSAWLPLVPRDRLRAREVLGARTRAEPTRPCGRPSSSTSSTAAASTASSRPSGAATPGSTPPTSTPSARRRRHARCRAHISEPALVRAARPCRPRHQTQGGRTGEGIHSIAATGGGRCWGPLVTAIAAVALVTGVSIAGAKPNATVTLKFARAVQRPGQPAAPGDPRQVPAAQSGHQDRRDVPADRDDLRQHAADAAAAAETLPTSSTSRPARAACSRCCRSRRRATSPTSRSGRGRRRCRSRPRTSRSSGRQGKLTARAVRRRAGRRHVPPDVAQLPRARGAEDDEPAAQRVPHREVEGQVLPEHRRRVALRTPACSRGRSPAARPCQGSRLEPEAASRTRRHSPGTPAWRQTLQRIVDMKNAGCFPPGAEANDNIPATPGFVTGQVVGWTLPSSIIQLMKGFNKEAKYNFFAMPGETRPTRASLRRRPTRSRCTRSRRTRRPRSSSIDYMATPARPAVRGQRQAPRRCTRRHREAPHLRAARSRRRFLKVNAKVFTLMKA